MIETGVNGTLYNGFFFQIQSYIFGVDSVDSAALWRLSKELIYVH